LVIVPPAAGVAPKVNVALAETASVPSEQLSTPPDGAAQLPWLARTAEIFAPAGTISFTMTPAASVGPLFFTVTE
jgi:hypothetical protein